VAGELRRQRAQNPRGMFFEPTPKGHRFYELCRQGKSLEEAFAIADREYTSDGLTLKPPLHGPDATNAILASGVSQMGEVQL
jgi:hypothetical protein